MHNGEVCPSVRTFHLQNLWKNFDAIRWAYMEVQHLSCWSSVQHNLTGLKKNFIDFLQDGGDLIKGYEYYVTHFSKQIETKTNLSLYCATTGMLISV
jgi:hypothetical protein